MRRFAFIVALVCCISIAAQDLQLLSQNDLLGTARYVSMAGAMTAVGGDPSAVKDNPAGLGIYRRMEVSLTLDEKMDRVHQAGLPKAIGEYNNFSATQAAFIFTFLDDYGLSDMVSNTFMLSYHRLANFHRQYMAGYSNEPVSLSDVIAFKTNGLAENDLQPVERWDNSEVGWLSCQGYDTYLVNPVPGTNPTQWSSVLGPNDMVSNQISVVETGYVNQYSLGWGCNIIDRIYLGASLNVISSYRNQTVKFYEHFGDSCSLANNTYVAQSGVGVNAGIGIIARPWQFLRIGASFITPSAMSLTTTNYGALSSYLYYPDSLGNYRLGYIVSETPQNRATERATALPLRTSVGVALQLKNYGLLSLQYDYAHLKGIHDTHVLRAGIEGVILNQFFLNAGYAYESTFAKSEPDYLAYNTVRTDAYSQVINRSHYITAGFGFRSSHVMVHGAYRLRMQQMDTYAHELATPFDMRALTHSIVLTVGFHTK